MDPESSSFAQMTFDLDHPKIKGTSDYVGMKKGNKTVIKDPT